MRMWFLMLAAEATWSMRQWGLGRRVCAYFIRRLDGEIDRNPDRYRLIIERGLRRSLPDIIQWN